MIEATITREPSTIDGTFGHFSISKDSNLFTCHSLELAWHDNQRNISCIPTGRYNCSFEPSSKGNCYRLANVPNRSGILIHAGNRAGDTYINKDLHTDVRGCILLGLSLGSIGDQRAVLASRDALNRLYNFTNYDDFTLTIIQGA